MLPDFSNFVDFILVNPVDNINFLINLHREYNNYKLNDGDYDSDLEKEHDKYEVQICALEQLKNRYDDLVLDKDEYYVLIKLEEKSMEI